MMGAGRWANPFNSNRVHSRLREAVWGGAYSAPRGLHFLFRRPRGPDRAAWLGPGLCLCGCAGRGLLQSPESRAHRDAGLVG